MGIALFILIGLLFGDTTNDQNTLLISFYVRTSVYSKDI